MSDIKLFKHSHPAFTTYAKPVPNGEDVHDLIDGMRAIMLKGDRRGPGVGLAANQVGVLKRVISIASGGFRENIINPIIVRTYGGKAAHNEGCLSFPGLSVMIIRHKQIQVDGFNEKWEPVRYKLKGFTARVVQHEVDHLNGITIKQLGNGGK